MHNAIILAFLRPATSGAKANGNVKKAVVPNHSHNLPEMEKVRPRLAETGSHHLGVTSGVHVQTSTFGMQMGLSYCRKLEHKKTGPLSEPAPVMRR